ncbi:hypothetical protein X975_24772, partial [Stegodyphus mimosarum]
MRQYTFGRNLRSWSGSLVYASRPKPPFKRTRTNTSKVAAWY